MIIGDEAGSICVMFLCVQGMDKDNCEITFSSLSWRTIMVTQTIIVSSLGLYTRSPEVMFSTKWSPISSFASALCDSVITGSIWLFMRPARTGNVRILAISVTVVFYTAAPGAVIAKCYLYELDDNGLAKLVVRLNARKSIRERERLGYNLTELPTIPTIL
ncbi:hypothetical protein BDR03DRAFT_977670 [Suillus americanus]|nr:hypothetical protein BDR03DRAFT_977670 [Suillus americanus]